jgi:hypothetical protein
MGVITDDLNNFLFNLSQYFFVSLPFGALHVELGAADLVIESR